eukprot:403331530
MRKRSEQRRSYDSMNSSYDSASVNSQTSSQGRKREQMQNYMNCKKRSRGRPFKNELQEYAKYENDPLLYDPEYFAMTEKFLERMNKPLETLLEESKNFDFQTQPDPEGIDLTGIKQYLQTSELEDIEIMESQIELARLMESLNHIEDDNHHEFIEGNENQEVQVNYIEKVQEILQSNQYEVTFIMDQYMQSLVNFLKDLTISQLRTNDNQETLTFHMRIIVSYLCKTLQTQDVIFFLANLPFQEDIVEHLYIETSHFQKIQTLIVATSFDLINSQGKLENTDFVKLSVPLRNFTCNFITKILENNIKFLNECTDVIFINSKFYKLISKHITLICNDLKVLESLTQLVKLLLNEDNLKSLQKYSKAPIYYFLKILYRLLDFQKFKSLDQSYEKLLSILNNLKPDLIRLAISSSISLKNSKYLLKLIAILCDQYSYSQCLELYKQNTSKDFTNIRKIILKQQKQIFQFIQMFSLDGVQTQDFIDALNTKDWLLNMFETLCSGIHIVVLNVTDFVNLKKIFILSNMLFSIQDDSIENYVFLFQQKVLTLLEEILHHNPDKRSKLIQELLKLMRELLPNHKFKTIKGKNS